MSEKQKYQELQQSYSKLSQQYNTLLEKNQNDLIKVKQKQKAFNETVEGMKNEREAIHTKYKTQIEVLNLQIHQMKSALENKDSKTKNKAEEEEELRDHIKNYKSSIQEMNSIIELKTVRLEEVEGSSRKLMDQNILVTAQNTALKAQMSDMNKKTEELQERLKIYEEAKKNKVKKVENTIQTQLSGEIMGSKDHKKLLNDFNNQIKKLNQNEDEKEKYVKVMKDRLKETNDELKRYIERDKRNNILIKKKNEEFQKMQDELEKERAKKTVKGDRKKTMNEESCLKCKELEQQNKLLKQMIKSAKTMVRVRQIEVQRYRNKETLNTSKVTDKNENKKSRGQLPPLKKN